MQESLRERTIGELIGQAFSLTFRNFGRLFLIQLLFGIILLALCLPLALIILIVAKNQGSDVVVGLTTVPFLIAFILLSPLPSAASIVAVSDNFTGQHHGVIDCYKAVFPMILKLLGLGFIVGIIVLLGTLLLIVPGVILLLMYCVATQALICEQLSVGEALRRSSTLTSGHKMRLLGLFLVLIVIGFLVGLVTDGLKAVLPTPQTTEDMAPLIILFISIPVLLLSTLSSVISGMFQTCATVAVYFDLRVRKDDFQLEQLADIVDRIAPAQKPSAL